MKRTKRRKQSSFDTTIVLNGKQVPVQITTYSIHTGVERHRVSIDNGPIHIFGWNADHSKFIEMEGSTVDPLTTAVKNAVSELLDNKSAA